MARKQKGRQTKSYKGFNSSTNIEKRKEDHKCNITYKFGSAIKEIGYDKFVFEVLDTVVISDFTIIPAFFFFNNRI